MHYQTAKKHYDRLKEYSRHNRKKVFAAAAVFLLIVILIIRGQSSAEAETRYILGSVTRGTLTVSVSGSGQVSASNQFDVKPKVSGEIIYVGAEAGKEVKAGALLVQLDSTNAARAIRDAETNLESAKISLEKLKKPAEALSLIQAENALTSANNSKDQAQKDLIKAYEDGYAVVTSAFLDLPSTIQGLSDILFGTNFGVSGQASIDAYTDLVRNSDSGVLKLRDETRLAYDSAVQIYEKTSKEYQASGKTVTDERVEALLVSTNATAKSIAYALKTGKNFLNFVQDNLIKRGVSRPVLLGTNAASIDQYTNTVNGHVSSLINASNFIQEKREAITAASRSITERAESLKAIRSGADALDVAASGLSVRQRENALKDARAEYANYFIRAPFAGTIAKVSAKKFDSASPGTALVTLISKEKIAEVSLNEVDVTKVRSGQKATLTFDAVDNLTIAGEVAEVDAVGTVTQGVVTYNVKVKFQTQDERVKPGMSVSAAIITEAKQNVLMVPSSALKNSADVSYVETLDGQLDGSASAQGVTSKKPPQSVNVVTGITNDTMTEIVEGIEEGREIIVRTTGSGVQSPAQSPAGLFGAGRGIGGGAIRIQR